MLSMTGSYIMFRLIDYLRRLIDSLSKLTTLVYRRQALQQ